MIDIHCHILPGVDDGPVDLSGSLAMAEMMVADGIREVVATPHVQWQGLDRVAVVAAVAALQQAFDSRGIALKLHPGGDVPSSLGLEGLQEHPLGQGPYVLLEFPHDHLPGSAEQLVFSAVVAGLIPVITHPERNPGFLREPDRLQRLVESGALVQITAGALLQEFGPDAEAFVRYALRKRRVHFMASDGHGSARRKPLLTAAVAVATKLIGPEVRALVEDNPRAVLAGDELP